MNISSEISFYEYSSSDYLSSNGTDVEVDYRIFFAGYLISVLLSFPLNSYVIWLIVTGTGNGLAAEFFILNLSVCEILLCIELIFVYLIKCKIWIVFALIDGLSVIGHHFFETLICVERYLAVVHPVIFLKYKPLRYRLMCSAVVWFTSFVLGGFNVIILTFTIDVYFFIVITMFLVFLSIKLYCCVAVLRVLKRSGPGERGREREEENHMKKRAFQLILITTVSMFIMHSPNIISMAFITPETEALFLFVAQLCFILSGLVQPVLFLYRVEKLNFMKCR